MSLQFIASRAGLAALVATLSLGQARAQEKPSVVTLNKLEKIASQGGWSILGNEEFCLAIGDDPSGATGGEPRGRLLIGRFRRQGGGVIGASMDFDKFDAEGVFNATMSQRIDGGPEIGGPVRVFLADFLSGYPSMMPVMMYHEDDYAVLARAIRRGNRLKLQVRSKGKAGDKNLRLIDATYSLKGSSWASNSVDDCARR